MSRESRSWVSAACDRLLELRNADVGWGYQGDGPAYSEPTAIGCLALLATDDQQSIQGVDETIDQSARWLAGIQQPDGAIGISADYSVPQWPTAFATLLWSQLSDYQRELAASLRWLQLREGHTFVKTKACVLGHDTSIPGWPWVAGTHPWLEPTGIAMLALCRNQLTGHQRIEDGVRMILDRAVATGGWNVGNSSAFGHQLRPQAGPTGIALLALKAALRDETSTITRACHYLAETLPSIRSAETLGWGLLGLQAWRARPADADRWLQESFANALALHDSPMRLSLLLLASSPTTLPRLGVTVAKEEEAILELPVS